MMYLDFLPSIPPLLLLRASRLYLSGHTLFLTTAVAVVAASAALFPIFYFFIFPFH